MICPHRKDSNGKPLNPTDAEIGTIVNCPVRLAEIRSRLSNISWWMRLLCQRVAQRANQEDEENGRFFQDRYRAVRLLDEASILACSAYVDLNIIRAGMAETIERSDHTSVQKRVDGWRERNRPEESSAEPPRPKVESIRESPDSFLSPLSIDENRDPIGSCASPNGTRCSDKGYLPISDSDYFQLLDWTARQNVHGKRGTTPSEVAPVLKRLGLAGTPLERIGQRLWKTLHSCRRSSRDHRLDSQPSHAASFSRTEATSRDDGPAGVMLRRWPSGPWRSHFHLKSHRAQAHSAPVEPDRCVFGRFFAPESDGAIPGRGKHRKNSIPC